MSNAITNYGTGATTQYDSSSTVTRHGHAHRHASQGAASEEPSTATDSVQFSQQLMEALVGTQAQNPLSTDSYGSDSSDYSLTAEQKKSLLADLQSKLNSQAAAASGTESGAADKTLAALGNELSGFDATQATDEQVSDLFDEVTQTLESAGPPPFPGEPPQQSGNNGLPSALKAMGGIVPPYAWNTESDDEKTQQTDVNPATALTTSQKKSILTEIQNRLSSATSTSSGDSASDSTADPLSELENELSGFDASKATDEQISSLFDQVTQSLASSRQIRIEAQ